jgi:hypothetical protein
VIGEGGDQPGRRDPSRNYPAERARQGRVILRKPWQRIVFIAGLAGCVLLALIVRFVVGH